VPGDEDKLAHVSDTALMVAACRAMETARPDGFVRDPFAERLAGPRGMAIGAAIPRIQMMAFGVGVRSRFMDELVTACVRDRGVERVVSVGCGLDTRPWRLDLPRDLHWIEIDFAEMLGYKERAMSGEDPRCRRQRIAADFNDPASRSAVFAAAAGAPGLMITEGLLMYLPGATVDAIAGESAGASGIRYWLTDITSPAFARAIGMDTFSDVQKLRASTHLDGVQILETERRHGWNTVERRSYLTDLMPFAAARIQAAVEARERSGAPPPQPVPPDDPTGIHLLERP
jgi:methyltransferase (TIGR00027 family)